MRHLIRYAIALTLSFAGFGFALANSAAPVVTSDVGSAIALTGWPGLVVLLLTAIAYSLRRLAPQGHFFHTGLGQVVLTAVTVAISTAIPVIESRGLNWQALANALVSAALTWMATSNPSVAAGTTAPMAVPPPTLQPPPTPPIGGGLQ
jgi:hypothetical protein